MFIRVHIILTFCSMSSNSRPADSAAFHLSAEEEDAVDIDVDDIEVLFPILAYAINLFSISFSSDLASLRSDSQLIFF